MRSYQGSDNGGVVGYEIRDNGIVLKFKDGRNYFYDHTRPGKVHVDNMKKLALSGSGLTTYINKYVRDNYAET